MGKLDLMTKFYSWLAYKLPKKLVYHAYIRLHVWSTVEVYTGKTPEEVTWTDACSAWSEKFGV